MNESSSGLTLDTATHRGLVYEIEALARSGADHREIEHRIRPLRRLAAHPRTRGTTHRMRALLADSPVRGSRRRRPRWRADLGA